MIKNRNVAIDAMIDITKIQGANAGFFFGEVQYVAKAGIQARTWLDPRVPGANLHKTLQAAIDKSVATRGDLIIACPGHTESISEAGALALDKAGIHVKGIGWGEMRPAFTFDTAITADMDIDAANVILENLLFVNGIDNLTAPIDVNAADFTMLNCETRDNNSGFHCDDFIQTVAAADRLKLINWVHNSHGGKTGAQTAISIVGGNDHIIIPSWMDGAVGAAFIENVTTACDNLQIFGNCGFPAYIRSRGANDVVITCVATTKGRIGPGLNIRLNSDSDNITEAVAGADMEFFQPINIVNADGQSSMQTNITASIDEGGGG